MIQSCFLDSSRVLIKYIMGTPIISTTIFIQTVSESPLETSVIRPNLDIAAPTSSKAVRMMKALSLSLLTFTNFLNRTV